MAFPSRVATRPYLIQNYSRDFLTIDCGEWTYGHPTIEVSPEDQKRLLRLGRYCSIGPEVRIFVGMQGRHATDRISTYPLRMAVTPEIVQAAARPNIELRPVSGPPKSLDTIIGHDVWIGARATIMAGVTIGNGAVIGACALVTKDVPPYAIVGGVPAEVLRYRFDEATIAEVQESEWWRLDPDEIWKRTGDGWALGATRAVARILSVKNDATSSNVDSIIATLRDDLSNAPAVLGKLDTAAITQLFVQPHAKSPLPRWPSEDVQRGYTGGAGKPLVDRAAAFARVLEQDGAFTPNWRGLDYGCGWGRIASYLLTRGTPEQLDLCDAWKGSLNLIDAGGFRNRAFLVSESLQPGDIEADKYDFIYAFSIFTHLPRPVFENNLRRLVAAVRPGGKVYFTVRHEPFLAHTNRGDQVLDADGFWFGGKNPNYGDAVVSRVFLERLAAPLGALRYLGTPESMQEVYAVTRR